MSFWKRLTKQKDTKITPPDHFSPPDNLIMPVYGPPMPFDDPEKTVANPIQPESSFSPEDNLMCTVYGPPPVIEELLAASQEDTPAPGQGWHCTCGYSMPGYAAYCLHCGTRRGEVSAQRYNNYMDSGAPLVHTMLCPNCNYGWTESNGGTLSYEDYCPLCGTKARKIYKK